MELQFSRDFGRTWSLLQDACLPSDVQCRAFTKKSVFTSDLYTGWHRVTMQLPENTRLFTKHTPLFTHTHTHTHTHTSSMLFLQISCDAVPVEPTLRVSSLQFVGDNAGVRGAGVHACVQRARLVRPGNLRVSPCFAVHTFGRAQLDTLAIHEGRSKFPPFSTFFHA